MGLLNSLRKYCIMKKVRDSADDSEKKKLQQEEMREESHQLDLKEIMNKMKNLMSLKINFQAYQISKQIQKKHI